jgi:sugar/nucleoside kinase (ribokinase family)
MTRKEFDVVVVGNVGIDTNVYFPNGDFDFTVESNFTENIDYVGQAGGYASRGFAQLEKKTAFVGYIGDDTCGRWIGDEFRRDGINTAGLFIDPSGTSRSSNFMW